MRRLTKIVLDAATRRLRVLALGGWRSIDDLPPSGSEDDEWNERCVVVWQDFHCASDQGVELTCLAHIRDGDFHCDRYINPVWRSLMDAPPLSQSS